MSWSLELSVVMLLGMSLASWLFVNKQGYKYALVYTLFSLIVYTERSLFFNTAPILLLILFLLNPKEIKGALIFGVTLMTVSAVAAAYSLTQERYDVFLVRDIASGMSIASAGMFLLPSHKDYSSALTLTLFSACFYSYANPLSPLIQVSLPFACLSLIPYLGMTVINNHFEGSFAHIYLTKALRALAKRLKISDKSKKTLIALQTFKPR